FSGAYVTPYVEEDKLLFVLNFKWLTGNSPSNFWMASAKPVLKFFNLLYTHSALVFSKEGSIIILTKESSSSSSHGWAVGGAFGLGSSSVGAFTEGIDELRIP